MSMIRKRGDENLVVAGPVDPVQAGGFTSGEQSSLMDPGNADISSLRVAPTSQSEAAIGAFRESIAAKALRGIEYLNIPGEDSFDVTKALGDRASQYQAEELEFLSDSRSNAELAQRMNQVTQTRENYADMAAHPVTGLAASMLDVDGVIGLGVGKAVTVSRSVRLLAGLTANSAVLGLASEGGHITPLDVIGTSLGVALGAIPRTRVRGEIPPVAAAEQAVDDVAPLVEPVPSVRPTPAQATAEELMATDSTIQIRQRTVPDPDYVPPKPDMDFSRPFVEATQRKGVKSIDTSTRNFVAAVLSNSDDLPEGSRILGAALHDSMLVDGDVPIRYRANPATSKVTLNTDGTVSTVLDGKAGAKPTLSESVASMTTYEKTIALHEAAHAKTITAIDSFHRGTLPDGLVKDAVNRIENIRLGVKGQIGTVDRTGIDASDWKNNVMYGVNSTHEFVAQLFNSESFRNVLRQIKLPGETTSVWSDLVRRVVQAFTGKAPEGTAFDNLVAAFEDLVKLPAAKAEDGLGATVKASAPDAIPTMQSAPLMGSKDIHQLFDKAGAAINKNFALYDAIKSLGAKASTLADQLVVDATGNTSTSAAHYARTAHLAANTAAAQVDTAISQALTARGWNTWSRLRNPQRYRAAQREFSESVYAQLADNHARYRDGSAIVPHTDPGVQKVVENFANSKWAEDQLQRIKAAGMLGSDLIESSPYYLPRRHSGTKVTQYLQGNRDVTRADIEGMYGSQFERMFAGQGMRPDTAKRLGKQMLRNMDQRAAGVSGYRQHVAGMSNDDIEFAMRNAGIEEDQIASFLQTANHAGENSNTVRNLRRRADFDMTAEYITKSGKTISPQLFVDKDVLGLMEGYSRTMSGRIGLAKAGFPDVRTVAAAVDEAAAEAADASKARDMLDNTVNQLLGYPTGENVPDILRSFSVASGAVQLANSGIYQLADSALMIKQFGITKVLRSLGSTPWGRDGLKLAQSADYGSRLRDVLEARNVLSGRYRTVLTHLDDNTDIGSLGIAHQMIQQMGQGTRFVNGMEYVRRGQSKLVAGLVGDTVDDAIRGNAEAVKAMSKFGLTDDLLEQARAAMKADPDLREWPDALRLEMETIGQSMADALVQENRLGEIPAWMQFSTLGKFILPYMNFVAGTWNKILRRTYAQDGGRGVAMMFAYQLPLTTLSSTVALAQANKEITPQTLTANVLTQLPLMSWMGYAVNMATQGPTNSIAALGLVDKAFSATSSIVSGDPDPTQIIRAVPFLSIIPGMRIMATAMGDDD